ncbi:MAG: sulfite exporter TauE/SafE family protein [Rhodoplanes sp.]|uniref:sulfite exporter TauE/SafE family protein n=1 Tax=Rhodoplanes sp. TaxID=1968906 RepID=UPI0017C9EBBB|nr:sulfite exporter TauE/SafE family protein [Rhodoplanes sp.]NVO14383.1 sulfite exporter TauE/SafE family protein [Rhodoplanes sp.]
MMNVPTGELVILAVGIMGGGVVTGILAGLFGIGGGAVLMPVLFEVFRLIGVPDDVRMQLCIGTSLAVIAPTAFRSYRSHKARGAALQDVVKLWTVPVVIGVILGSAVAVVAPAVVFKIVFGCTVLLTACKLLFLGDRFVIAPKLPGPWVLRVYGAVIGLLSSLMGVGGGAMASMVLTFYGQSIHKAVATSAGIGVPIAVTGTIGYMLAGIPHMGELPPLSIGFVSLVGFALMAPISTYTARFGAVLAHRMPRRHLEIAFGLFLILTASRILLSMVG